MKKFKNTIAFILTVVMCVISSPLVFTTAYALSYNTTQYYLDEDQYVIFNVTNRTITDGIPVRAIGKYAFSSANVSEIFIPSTVKIIDMAAFRYCRNLQTVHFPDSLEIIGENAFRETKFESLDFPDSVVEIGKNAFSDCSELKTLELPDSLEILGSRAFNNCDGLIEVTIPANVKTILGNPFSFCDSLQSISINENNKYYTIVDGILLSKTNPGNSGTRNTPNELSIVTYPISKTDTAYSVPNGITRIADAAFAGNEFLRSVTIPNSVKEIGESAFSGTTSLESIELSKNIKEIPYGMFYGCKSLQTVVIPEGVEYIRPETFVGCHSLKTIHLPNSLKEICIELGIDENEGPFRGCNDLTVVYYAGTADKWEDLTDIYQLEGGDLSSSFYFLTASGYRLKNAYVFWTTPFKDIKRNDGKWFTESVIYCYKYGYLSGISVNEFDYNSSVNRQMFATILAKIDGAEISEYAETSFTDVPAGQWYSNAIEWAYRSGYTAGLDRGIFGRKYPVTREQLATFLYTYSEKKGYDVSGRADIGAYTDHANVSDYALEAMKWAVSKGIISGTDKRELLPKDSITRAQMAVVIKSFVENIIPVKDYGE